MTDDQLLYYGALAVGVLVLFAGIPEGLVRVASLALAPSRSPGRLAPLPPSPPPLRTARVQPSPPADVPADVLAALERAIVQQAGGQEPDNRPARQPGVRSDDSRSAHAADGRLADVRLAEVRPSSAWPTEALASAPLAWFFEEKGVCQGPASDRAVRDLLRQRSISHDTLVWNETFGPSWRPLRETGLVNVAPLGPPPLPRQVSARRPRRWLVPSLAALLLAMLAVGTIAYLYLQEPATSDEPAPVAVLPVCDSPTAETLLRQAILSAPVARLLNVVVINIRDVEEIAFDAAASKRTCRAVAVLGAGGGPVRYTLEWLDPAEQKVWIEIQQMPF